MARCWYPQSTNILQTLYVDWAQQSECKHEKYDEQKEEAEAEIDPSKRNFFGPDGEVKEWIEKKIIS